MNWALEMMQYINMPLRAHSRTHAHRAGGMLESDVQVMPFLYFHHPPVLFPFLSCAQLRMWNGASARMD